MSVSSDSHSPFPVLPTRSDSVRPILALSDSVARLRFLPPDAGKEISAPRRFLGNPAGLSFPDSCFCPSRGGSPAGRPSGHAHSTNHAHVYAPYPPRHPLCHRSALRAPHSTVTFERRLITRASEISWAVAWWSQSSARPILILGRRSPIPAGAWCRGLNGMPASDAAWRRPAATPQAVVGAAQRCSQRHVCSFAVGSAV